MHGELQTHGLSGEGIPYLDGSDGFSVQEVHVVRAQHMGMYYFFLFIFFLMLSMPDKNFSRQHV